MSSCGTLIENASCSGLEYLLYIFLSIAVKTMSMQGVGSGTAGGGGGGSKTNLPTTDKPIKMKVACPICSNLMVFEVNRDVPSVMITCTKCETLIYAATKAPPRAENQNNNTPNQVCGLLCICFAMIALLIRYELLRVNDQIRAFPSQWFSMNLLTGTAHWCLMCMLTETARFEMMPVSLNV